MNYYFAYGSNLHHSQMKRRCPNCRFIKKITLNNYKLTFRSKYGAADIEKEIKSVKKGSKKRKEIKDSKDAEDFLRKFAKK